MKCDRGHPRCGWCQRNNATCEYRERKKPGLRAGKLLFVPFDSNHSAIVLGRSRRLLRCAVLINFACGIVVMLHRCSYPRPLPFSNSALRRPITLQNKIFGIEGAEKQPINRLLTSMRIGYGRELETRLGKLSIMLHPLKTSFLCQYTYECIQ